jgi:hypothetical protein
MSPGRLILCAAAAWSAIQAADPFSLKLPDLSAAWIPAGAVIRIPDGKCAELQVRLAKPWSQEIGVDQLDLEIDGAYPRYTRGTGFEGHILSVRTREPLGLLAGDRHIVYVETTGEKPLRAEWSIQKWDKPFIEATVVGRDGMPVGIRIERPAGGVVLSDRGASTVRFVGEVSAGLGARLTIAGQDAKRAAGLPGFHFDQQIDVPTDAREVVVVAVDETPGDSTMLILPVLSPAGN